MSEEKCGEGCSHEHKEEVPTNLPEDKNRPKPQRIKPYIETVKPGKYAWCACGQSKKDPYCDGTHASVEGNFSPIIEVVEKEKKVAWCGCKFASSAPHCNGSHAKYQMKGDHYENVSTWRAKGCHSSK